MDSGWLTPQPQETGTRSFLFLLPENPNQIISVILSSTITSYAAIKISQILKLIEQAPQKNMAFGTSSESKKKKSCSKV